MFDKFVFPTIFTKIYTCIELNQSFFARNFKPHFNQYNYIFLVVLS